MALLQVLFLPFAWILYTSIHFNRVTPGEPVFSWASWARTQLVSTCSHSSLIMQGWYSHSLNISEETYQEVLSHIAKINICQRYCLVSGEQILRRFIMSLVCSESRLPLWEELSLAYWFVAWKGQFPTLLWRSLAKFLFGFCHQLLVFARRKRKLKVCSGFLFGERHCSFTNFPAEQIPWLWNWTSNVIYGVLYCYQSILVSRISSWKQSLWTVNIL